MKKWKELPDFIKNEITYKYYQILDKKKYNLLFKRIFDIVFSVLLLVILSPILLLLGICIKIDSKGPIFYRQERVTRYNKTFKIFKFRTMVQNADKIGSLITIGKDPRITRIGNIIRKYRLDEIPQLINVLLGDMTFVGTRPEVRKYVNEYTDEMKATLLMPAGITSEASIRYKDEAALLDKIDNVDDIYVEQVLPKKMNYNLLSIKNFSFWNDIKTIYRTIFAVLGKEYKDDILVEEINKKEVINK
mgnify:CR=1 FL=1